MKKVIFCNDVNKLRQLVHNKNEQPIQYLLLGYTKETNKVMHFIKSSSNFVEIKQDLFNNLRRDFQNKFVSFVAELNRENHSLLWWCLNFTNKNPISTQLCTEVFHVLSIVHILQSTNINTLLVITKNADIVRQFYRYARNKPIHVINAISGKVDIIRLLMRYTPCGVLYAFLRMVYCSVYAKIRCPIQLSKHKEYTVVLSLLSEQSFRKNMAYSDVYFGKFIDYLHEKHCDFINVMIIRPLVYRRLLKKAWSRAVQIPIFPLEYFLGIKELLLCFAKALLKYFSQIKVKAGIEIDGINLAYLVKKTIRNDYMTPSFFDNIRVYFAIKVLAQKLLLKRFFYPFENRPFEKMVVCALREISPDTHITGYQHAALSLRHTNFLLGKDEYVFTPLPDSIITMGQITKDVMKEYGNFPEHLVKVGCALRQAPFKGNLKDKKARIKNIFIALATPVEEYVRVIKFLDETFTANSPYTLWIRPHPVYSLEGALRIAGEPKFKFYKANQETLNECYQWADAVLYVHTTLSIEAILRGIPVINLDIGNCLNPDPLFNFTDFKWVVEKPEFLIPAIHNIDSLSEEEFYERQKKASDYAKQYLFEVTEKSLASFIQ